MNNSGNATLTFPTPASGTDPSIATGFTLGGSSTCPQLSVSSIPMTLAVGASCTDLVSFSPNASGTIGGSLVITDNALNAPGPSYTTQSVALSGTSRLLAPTIVFTVPNHTYGDAPFVVSASSNSTGAFTYTVVSGPATISGATVTLTAAGLSSCKPLKRPTPTIPPAPATPPSALPRPPRPSFLPCPTIPMATLHSSSAQVRTPPVLSPTPWSPARRRSRARRSLLPERVRLFSGPATVSGATIILTGAGSVVLQASEASTGNYLASSSIATFTVSAATPTLAFNVLNHTYGDAAFPVAASSNSTGGFTYTVVSGPATIAGATVTLTGAGTVVLQVSEAATGNYNAAILNATFTVAAAMPTLTFTVPNHTYADAPFVVSAGSNSTGTFTYTVVSGPATISAAMVTVTGAGTAVLQASDAATGNYLAGSSNATFTVAAATPTIVFAVPNHTYGDAAFSVGATSNSTGAFTYTVVSGPATISGLTVTLTGPGTVLLQASEAATSNYLAGSSSATFTVATNTPTITFTVPNHTYGDAPFSVGASSNSTGAFTYTVVSGPATLVGSTVTLTGAGLVMLSASQAATQNYAAGNVCWVQ